MIEMNAKPAEGRVSAGNVTVTVVNYVDGPAIVTVVAGKDYKEANDD